MVRHFNLFSINWSLGYVSVCIVNLDFIYLHRFDVVRFNCGVLIKANLFLVFFFSIIVSWFHCYSLAFSDTYSSSVGNPVSNLDFNLALLLVGHKKLDFFFSVLGSLISGVFLAISSLFLLLSLTSPAIIWIIGKTFFSNMWICVSLIVC